MEISRFEHLTKALEAERQHEEEFYLKIIQSKSIKERQDAGLLWYPVKQIRASYTLGEYIEIEIERTGQVNKSHKLKRGMGVRLFKEGREKDYHGVISYIRKDKLRFITNNEYYFQDNDIQYGMAGVELTYDERPYRVMSNALQAIHSFKDPNKKSFFKALENGGPFDKERQAYHSVVLPYLNSSQNEAIQTAMKSDELAIIHGPPGTGKTTTLVALILQLIKEESKILVCAPSNGAVDHITKLLSERGVPVLRVGNISRIEDEVGELTLEEKMRNHKDWSHIKKVRIEAQEARKMARQYKRNFGEEERRNRGAMFKEASELMKWSRQLEERLQDLILSETKVICTTLIGAAHSSIDQLRYTTCIIDEASQALEPACLNAMIRANRTILAGDHKQLPPVVKSRKAEDLGLDITLLDRLSENIAHVHMLDLQYRMHEDILKFSNEKFYKGKLNSDKSAAKKLLRGDSTAFVFIDTSGCSFDEEFDHQKRSYKNSQEYYLLREYILTQKEKQLGHTIGLISPYNRQVEFMREEVKEDNDLKDLLIDVDTIDGFQGRERDIIYISLVRSNMDGNIGFLSDERRLNVAMTRAKSKLVLIGDLTTLTSHSLYRDLAKFVEDNNFYRSAWEFMSY